MKAVGVSKRYIEQNRPINAETDPPHRSRPAFLSSEAHVRPNDAFNSIRSIADTGIDSQAESVVVDEAKPDVFETKERVLIFSNRAPNYAPEFAHSGDVLPSAGPVVLPEAQASFSSQRDFLLAETGSASNTSHGPPSSRTLKSQESLRLERFQPKTTKQKIMRRLAMGHPKSSLAIIATSILGKEVADGENDNIATTYSETNEVTDKIYRALKNHFIWCISGIFLMIVENEVLYSQKNEPSNLTTALKICISITTVFSIYYMSVYYRIYLQRMKLRGFSIRGGAVLPMKQVVLFMVEFFVMLVHPLPWVDGKFAPYNGYLSIYYEFKLEYTYDAFFGLLMFGRIYLFARMLIYASGLHVRTAEVIGNMNKVDIDAAFAIRAMIRRSPYKLLFSFLCFNLVSTSYCIHMCERPSPHSKTKAYLDSVWFMFNTIAALGYGDSSVTTLCGRSVAAIGSIAGKLSTALIIMIASHNPLLTNSQTRVLSLLAKEEWNHNVRNKAVLSVQRLWRLQRSRKYDPLAKLRAFGALNDWRVSRREYGAFLDKEKSQNNIQPLIAQLVGSSKSLANRMDEIHFQMIRIQRKLDSLERVDPSVLAQVFAEPQMHRSFDESDAHSSDASDSESLKGTQRGKSTAKKAKPAPMKRAETLQLTRKSPSMLPESREIRSPVKIEFIE